MISKKNDSEDTRIPPAEHAVRMKVTLKGSRPPIWRRIVAPDTMTLDQLHRVIQTAMGWGYAHLHSFEIDGIEYGDQSALDDWDDDPGMDDESTVMLRNVVYRPKQKFTYLYDFGDGWEHQILVEAIEPIDPNALYPACLKGKRACPPEDCGGIHGYDDLLAALNSPDKSEEDKELLEAFGGDFDPEAFDPQAVNRQLEGKRIAGAPERETDLSTPETMRSQSKPRSATRPPDDTVSETQWRYLYDLATRIREMAPWRWMDEDDIFGVKDPENGEILFISVMGALGEHLAVAVYPGAEGLMGFMQMQDARDSDKVADIMMGIHQIQMAFGNRENLMSDEIKRIKNMGLTFRGRTNWPYFRGYRPGWHPWPPDARETRRLTLALEQVLEVAPRIRGNPDILDKEQETNRWLVRVLLDQEGKPVWTDSYCKAELPAKMWQIRVPEDLIQQVGKLSGKQGTLQADVFPSFMNVAEKKGQRPQIPYLMLVVDADRDIIVGFELMPVETTIHDLWAEVPERFLNILTKAGFRPSDLAVPDHNRMYGVLEPICQCLKINLKTEQYLPSLNDARQSMLQGT